MKLHLPKSLFAAVMVAVAGVTQQAMGETYNLLDAKYANAQNSEHWVMGTNRGSSKPTYTAATEVDDVVTPAMITTATNGGWNQNYASLELESILSATEDTPLTFSVTMTHNEVNTGANAYNSSFGVAFVGSQQAIVVGSPKYNVQTVGYVTSSVTDAIAYPVGSNWATPGTYTNVAEADYKTLTGASFTNGTSFTIGGTITKTDAGYSMTLTFNDTEYDPITLGNAADITRVTLFADGGSIQVSNLTVTGTNISSNDTWTGTTENNTWSATSLAGGAATTELSKVTFAELAEGISNTVVIDGSVTAHDITINDDYTFQSAGTATLNANKITIADGKTLTYSGTGDLTIGCDITGDVSISGGTLNSGKITGDVTVTGGALSVSGPNAINGNLSITNGTVNAYVANGSSGSVITAGKTISIYEGGTLKLSGHDMLRWLGDAPASILLKGKEGEGNMATLNINDTNGSCTLTTMFNMQGYSQVTGSSFNSYAEDDNTIEGDIKTKTGVLVSGTNNKIATTEVQIRANWVVDVTTGGELEVSSVIKDGNNDKSGKLVKKGEGTLTLSGTNTQTRGTIIEDGTIIADNDKAMGDAGVTINKGTLQVGVGEADSKDVNLTITGGLSLTQKSDANKVALSEGSSLTLGDIKFTGSKNDGSIVRVNDGANTAAYSAGNASYSVSNATVTVSGSTDVSISNRLIDVALVNNSTGKVAATNGYNNLTAIEAVNGNIHVQGQQGQHEQTYHDLSALTVGAGKTVGIHTKWNGSITDTENQATVTVAGTATFGEGANLYAGLTLADGASLTLDGALTMHGGILTLGSNITLDSTTLTSITSLADGDTTVTLFTGVGSLTLSGPALLSETGQYTLNQIFAGEGLENFYLSYKDGEVYAGKVVVAPTPGIPEPATATLSLLALCGLAARRRRK